MFLWLSFSLVSLHILSPYYSMKLLHWKFRSTAQNALIVHTQPGISSKSLEKARIYTTWYLDEMPIGLV